MKIINSRADLDVLRGTAEFALALHAIAGAATIKVDVADYPDGYGGHGYDGPPVDPQWAEREDDAVLYRLGIGREELAAELAALDS